MKLMFGATRIEAVQGDITIQDVDAIVNPANEGLVLGGGVAGAIARRGGPSIQRECDLIGHTPVGTAVITTGGNLSARHVIHAVGPRSGEGREEQKLGDAVRAVIRVAEENEVRSLAMPAISTGIFGYPLEEAAPVIVSALKDGLGSHESTVERVVLCLFDENALRVFETALAAANA